MIDLPDEQALMIKAIKDLVANTTMEMDREALESTRRRVFTIQSFKQMQTTLNFVDAIVTKWDNARIEQRWTIYSPEFRFLRQAKATLAAVQRREKYIRKKYENAAFDRLITKKRLQNESVMNDIVHQIHKMSSQIERNELKNEVNKTIKEYERQEQRADEIAQGKVKLQNLMIDGAKEKLEYQAEEIQTDVEIREMLGLPTREVEIDSGVTLISHSNTQSLGMQAEIDANFQRMKELRDKAKIEKGE